MLHADASQVEQIALRVCDKKPLVSLRAEYGPCLSRSLATLVRNKIALVARSPPLPVLRERAGVRVFTLKSRIWNFRFKTLTLTLSRSTGRGDRSVRNILTVRWH